MKKADVQEGNVPYDLYERQAMVAQGLAHPVRIAILNVLRQGPHCVQDIACHIGAKQSNVSRHLSVMVAAGILAYEKQAQRVVYKIKTPCALRFFDCLSDCLKERIQEDSKALKII